MIYSIYITGEDDQGQVIYEIIGIAPGDRYFRIGRTTGFVFVNGDLKSDRALSYTLLLEAYYSGNPQQKAAAEMHIRVERNEFGPVFAQNAYSQRVLESATLGSIITTIEATDRDTTDQIRYSLISDDTCQEYFYLNGDTGVIYLKKLLTSDAAILDFECMIEATDEGYPEAKTRQVVLTVDVERNMEIPKFSDEM